MSFADRSQLDRRAVLLGGASLALLAACGNTKDRSGDTTTRRSKYSLVAFFGGSDAVQVGLRQRVTFGIGDDRGALIDNGPAALPIEVVFNNKVIDRVMAPRHRKGLPRGYYPVTFVPRAAGFYTARTKIGGESVDASFEVGTKSLIPHAGQPMIVVDTPTIANPRRVKPICTRSPRCPLHELNLRDALAAHKPIAILMATPAYCQVAICGPVLDVLLSQRREFGSRVQMIHAEVYADGQKAAADITKATLAPALRAYHLPFEPALFLAGADGRVSTRLDTIFDEVEVRGALQALVAGR